MNVDSTGANASVHSCVWSVGGTANALSERVISSLSPRSVRKIRVILGNLIAPDRLESVFLKMTLGPDA